MSDLKKLVESHERNNYIRFYEDEHEYYWYPSGDFRKKTERVQFGGVTSWMSEFLPPFDKDQHIKSANNPYSKWYGMEPEEVKAAWQAKTDYGTAGHKAVENMINVGEYDENWSEYLDQTLELLDTQGITPIKAEWVVFDESVKRASAIDIVGEKDGKVVPVDMKFFSDGMKFVPYNNQLFNYPLEDLTASKFNKVSLQLSIYSGILDKNYKDVPLHDERYVLCFSDDGAELLPTLNLGYYVNKLYEFNK